MNSNWKTYLEILLALQRIIRNKSYLSGYGMREADRFEEALASFLRVRRENVLALNSGTDALILALRILGVKPGDEVIVPAFTFVATASAVSWTGAIPKFVDIKEDDFTIDPERIKDAITSKTKAIIPVHLFGFPVDISQIKKVLYESGRGVKIIEDAAPALGAVIDSKYVGTLSHAGCFSFSSIKPLAALGNGGALFLKDEASVAKARLIAGYGARRHYFDYPEIGINCRMQEIYAAILVNQLKFLPANLAKRENIASIYDRELQGVGDIILPKKSERRIYYRYVIRAKKRDELLKHLETKISSKSKRFLSINYPVPVPYLQAFRYLNYKEGDFPVAEKVSKEVLSLPITEEIDFRELNKIIKTVRAFFNL